MDPSEESTSKSPEGIDHSLPCSLLSLLILEKKKNAFTLLNQKADSKYETSFKGTATLVLKSNQI